MYLHDYASPKEARQQLREYLQFYTHQRLHQALDYWTPAEVYLGQENSMRDQKSVEFAGQGRRAR